MKWKLSRKKKSGGRIGVWDNLEPGVQARLAAAINSSDDVQDVNAYAADAVVLK